jgi:midasin (ATPase involved in ribosome maturation)
MFDILYAVSSDVRINNPSVQENQKMLENYVLTRDNFFKMCFLIQRERCGIPCIIEGESGVGKTALITFLSKYIFKNKLRVYNIHAGIHEKELS